MAPLKAVAHWRAWWVLGPFAIALLLRVVFFVGLASGDPQDDGIYYQLARDMAQHGLAYLKPFEHLASGFVANPIDQFPFRPLATGPTALVFMIVGPSEAAAVVWPFMCSLAVLLLVFRIGMLVGTPTTGMLASVLYAIYPLEVINGTRILGDVPLEFFCAASLWLWLESRERKLPALSVLAGIAGGLGYLTKPPGLFFVACLCAWAVIDAWRGRMPKAAAAGMIGGVALVLLCEASFYAWHLGAPFATLQIHRAAEAYKYAHEGAGEIRLGRLHVLYNNGRPFELSQLALGLQREPTDLFGYFGYLFAAAAAAAIPSRSRAPLALLALVVFLILEWGPVNVEWDSTERAVRYFMLPKQARFLTMVTPPLVVVAAALLEAVARRHRAIVVGVLLVLTVTGVRAAAETSAFYRSNLSDLRTLTRLVETARDRTFWGDLWMVEHVRIFSRYTAENIAVLPKEGTLEQLRGACLVVGGSRGSELTADYVESTQPGFVGEANRGTPPSGGVLVARVTGGRGALRAADLQVYCFPR